MQTVRYWKMEMISDRKDRVSNKFYSWIFMIAGLRFPPIYDMKVAILQQKISLDTCISSILNEWQILG